MTPPSPIRQLEVFLKARMEKACENVSDDATQKSFRNASDLLDQEECLRFCFRNKPPGTGVHFKNAFNALPTSLWSEDESWLLHQTSLNMYVLNSCIDLEKIARRLQKMFRRRSNWIQTHIPALGVTAQLAEMQRHQHSKKVNIWRAKYRQGAKLQQSHFFWETTAREPPQTQGLNNELKRVVSNREKYGWTSGWTRSSTAATLLLYRAAQNFDSEKQKLISWIMSNLAKPTTKRKNPYKHLTEGGLTLQSSQFR